MSLLQQVAARVELIDEPQQQRVQRTYLNLSDRVLKFLALRFNRLSWTV